MLIRNGPVDIFIADLMGMDINGQTYHGDFIMEIIQNKKTVLEIWVRLSPYLNFLNYEILQHIIFTSGDKTLQGEMDGYASAVETFFHETRLQDFLACWPVRGEKPPEDDLKQFVVTKHKLDWNTCTLHDLDQLEKSLARKLLISCC